MTTEIWALIPAGESFVLDNGLLPNAVHETGRTFEQTLGELTRRTVDQVLSVDHARWIGNKLIYLTKSAQLEVLKLQEAVTLVKPHDIPNHQQLAERFESLASKTR
jgi:hypothetical protein